MIYKMEELQNWNDYTCPKIRGKWVPARPENYKYRSFVERLKDAWAVFIGKADAFIWPEKQ